MDIFILKIWEAYRLNFKNKSILLFILLFTILFIFTTAIKANELSDQPKLFSFNSYIEITYDNESLNEPIALERTTTVPLTIKYSTDVPSDFLKFVPWRLRNYILYGNMIAPQQTINLSIIDTPDWMATLLASNQFSIDIPLENEPVEFSTSLVLEPALDAPAQPYTIVIEASCGQIGRINSFSTQIDISFTPEYRPVVTLFPSSEKSYKLSYNTDIQTFFEIQCLANKKSRVTPIVKNAPENVTITFNPKYLDINVDERDICYVNISADSSFKHNASVVFSVTIQGFPLNEEFPTFESNETISYLLIPPIQEEEDGSIDINLLLNIIFILIIIILIINFKWKKWW